LPDHETTRALLLRMQDRSSEHFQKRLGTALKLLKPFSIKLTSFLCCKPLTA